MLCATYKQRIVALRRERRDTPRRVTRGRIGLILATWVQPLRNILALLTAPFSPSRGPRHVGVVIVLISLLGLSETGCDQRDEGAKSIAQLDDSNADQRIKAVRFLGQTKDRRAVEPLINALKDRNSIVRAAAAIALGEIGDARATQPLIAILAEPDDPTDAFVTMKTWASKALGQIKDPQSIASLRKLLRMRDFKYHNVGYIIDVLRDIGSIDAIDTLIDAVRAPPFDDYYPGLPIEFAVGNALVAVGSASVEPLIAVLNDRDVEVQKLAIEVLGRLKDPRAVNPVLSLLKSPIVDGSGSCLAVRRGDYYSYEFCNSGIQMAAVRTLGMVGTPAVEPLIASLQNDLDPGVRWRSAEALGNIKDPFAMRSLFAALEGDENMGVKTRASAALCAIGAPAVEFLVSALHDQSVDVRLLAADALSKIKDTRIKSALASVIQARDFPVIRELCEFYVKLGEPESEDILIEALNTSGVQEDGKIGVQGDLKKVALCLVTSGNPKLDAAGRSWAARNGYEIQERAVPR